MMMKATVRPGAIVAMAMVLASLATSAAAQTFEFFTSNLKVGPVVRNAPYSGEGVTIVSQTLGDGTRIERTTTAKVYRDGAGRERREQTVSGLAALNLLGSSENVTTIFDPVGGANYTLDPTTHTARRMPLGFTLTSLANGGVSGTVTLRRGGGDAAPIGALRAVAPTGQLDVRRVVTPDAVPAPMQDLGKRQIESVTAIGTLSKATIPMGQIGNDRPIEVTDERWTSPDLGGVVVLSKHHDPRTGDVEYRLTNIIRAEPSADLFTVPPDYQVTGPEVLRRSPEPPK